MTFCGDVTFVFQITGESWNKSVLHVACIVKIKWERRSGCSSVIQSVKTHCKFYTGDDDSTCCHGYVPDGTAPWRYRTCAASTGIDLVAVSAAFCLFHTVLLFPLQPCWHCYKYRKGGVVPAAWRAFILSKTCFRFIRTYETCQKMLHVLLRLRIMILWDIYMYLPSRSKCKQRKIDRISEQKAGKTITLINKLGNVRIV
jgi:hypothetical protein